jgi:uncharacterized iron-regulated membrane protein
VLRLIYKWHKWIGVSVGLILAMWLFTGIIMVTGPRPPSVPIRRLDFSTAVISPAQASARSAAVVNRLELIAIGSVPIYKISTDSGTKLIDARSGEPFVVTDSLAEAIAMEASGISGAARTTRVKSDGGAPAYRIVFSDPASTVVEVDANGAARVADRLKRFRNVMGGLHTFGVLRRVIDSRNTVAGLLVIVAGTALVSVVTGYVMALPRRRRPRASQDL